MNFENSQEWLTKSLDRIPLGTQTYSKSAAYYPWPIFIDHADGATIYDLDGNSFLDFVCALGPITLGYNYPAINEAIKNQLNKGIIFSLPSRLELEFAEILCAIVPGAEMVRFLKTGSEACNAAVRVARAYTGKDKVVSFSYHGWGAEFSILTERKKGLPPEYQNSIVEFPYNSISKLTEIFSTNLGKVACVIMEPVVVQPPSTGYLAEVQRLCHENNALLIYDEVVTGGRFPPFTASGYFGITPDLTVIGKGCANGASLAAVCGSRSVMREFEDVMVSGTYHGNCLDLAAGIATIKEMESKSTIEHCWNIGQSIMFLLERNGIQTQGYPCRPMIVLPNDSAEAKTLFLEGMLERGFLLINSMVLNICYSHTGEHARSFAAACSESMTILQKAIADHNLSDLIRGKTIKTAFSRI